MPNVSEAKRQAAILDDLGGFGEERSNVEVVGKAGLPTAEAMLALYAQEFLEAARDKLVKSNSISSGKLEESLEFRITTFGKAFKLELLALDYYEFVDQGVQGVSPNSKNRTSPFRFRSKFPNKIMATEILKWVRTNTNAGRFETQTKNLSKLQQKRKALGGAVKKSDDLKALAYAISTNIKKKGLKKTDFWTGSFNKVFKDFPVKMSEALGEDIQVDLKNLVKGIKKKR